MKKKEYVIIIVVFLIVAIPIAINESILRPKLKLINDVVEILKTIEKYDKDIIQTEEILINNKYKLGEKEYKIEGVGVIFLEDNPSVMLNRDGKCAMKLPFSEDIMYQAEECPTYKLLNGMKTPIATSGDGLYKKGKEYIYIGENVNNYVSFNGSLWRIVSLDGEAIKLVAPKGEKIAYSNRKDLYTKLGAKYKSLISKHSVYLVKENWEIGTIEVNNKDFFTKEKKIASYIGIIDADMYMDSLSNYEINDGRIKVLSKSYLTAEMLLSNENAYLNKHNIIYINSDIYGLELYPVLKLNEKVLITKGSGIKNDPYVLNIETE